MLQTSKSFFLAAHPASQVHGLVVGVHTKTNAHTTSRHAHERSSQEKT